ARNIEVEAAARALAIGEVARHFVAVAGNQRVHRRDGRAAAGEGGKEAGPDEAEQGGERGRLLRQPAPHGRVVDIARLDPFGAARRLLELPEGRLGLEPVDEEVAALERRLAMRRGGDDEDDALARLEPAVAVDDERGFERPAPARLR